MVRPGDMKSALLAVVAVVICLLRALVVRLTDAPFFEQTV